jgi:hypothetical protein
MVVTPELSNYVLAVPSSSLISVCLPHVTPTVPVSSCSAVSPDSPAFRPCKGRSGDGRVQCGVQYTRVSRQRRQSPEGSLHWVHVHCGELSYTNEMQWGVINHRRAPGKQLLILFNDNKHSNDSSSAWLLRRDSKL